MKVGDLVTVFPAKVSTYLIVGEDPDRENNWPNSRGESLGRLYKLFDSQENCVVDMHEMWIKVLNERNT